MGDLDFEDVCYGKLFVEAQGFEHFFEDVEVLVEAEEHEVGVEDFVERFQALVDLRLKVYCLLDFLLIILYVDDEFLEFWGKV